MSSTDDRITIFGRIGFPGTGVEFEGRVEFTADLNDYVHVFDADGWLVAVLPPRHISLDGWVVSYFALCASLAGIGSEEFQWRKNNER